MASTRVYIFVDAVLLQGVGSEMPIILMGDVGWGSRCRSTDMPQFMSC